MNTGGVTAPPRRLLDVLAAVGADAHLALGDLFALGAIGIAFQLRFNRFSAAAEISTCPDFPFAYRRNNRP